MPESVIAGDSPRVAVYLDFDNIVISRYDQVHGRNSFQKDGWLPPDPPTGHGPHHYLFQVFALARPADLPASPGRGALLDALRDNVIAKGMLTGTYERA